MSEEERREAIVDTTLDTIAGAVVSHLLEERTNLGEKVSADRRSRACIRGMQTLLPSRERG
jgi:hypothetical protein